MAEDKTPATPAGDTAQQTPTSGGIDINAITQAAVKAATEAATAAVTAAIKPITDEVSGLKQSLGKLPTPESITKTVTDAVAAQAEAQSKVSARQKFINEKLAGIPDAFHSMIGNDPTKFEDQAKALREALKATGFKAAEDSADAGDASGGRKAAIEKLVKEKLGGNADLGKLLTGATDEELAAQADAVAAQFKQIKPDFGGAASTGGDGGQTPNDTLSNAGAGGFLKMPGAPAPAPGDAATA